MRKDPVNVLADAFAAGSLLNEYVYRYHYRMFPVVSPLGELEGCVRVRDLQSTPREEWDHKRVANVMTQCEDGNTVSPGFGRLCRAAGHAARRQQQPDGGP
jgi:hypothetical protein